MASVIRVLSWNINGLKKKLEKPGTDLLNIFDRYDIVLLQETKIGKMKDGKDDDKDWDLINKALENKYALVKLEDQTCRETEDNQEEEVEKKETRRRKRRRDEGRIDEVGEEEKETKRKTMYMTYFRSSSKGVAIIVNKPHTLLKDFSEGGDYAWVHVEIDQQKYTFVSVYYHFDYPDLICNLMLKIFNSFLTEWSDAYKSRLVIGGDFNTTLDPKLDATEDNPDHAARRNRLNEFLRVVKLSDVWRKMHHGERQYTHDNNGKGSRLDYVFMLENDMQYVTSCEILDDIVLSDHSPVSLTLNNTDSPQPTGE
ncbi:hypothetical protein R3I94_007047 [Phoxinus phoxinus]